MSKQIDWPYIINLGNSIIGVSVLAMPFCFHECGVLLGVILLLGSAWLTSITCNLLMKAAVTSKKRSYEFLALHTFGPVGKFAVEISIIGMLLGTCVAFHVVIGDLGPTIVSKILGIENSSNLRTVVMVVLGLFVALPLGLLKNVESLSNISAISIGFYVVFVAEVFVSAFPNLWSGLWVTKIDLWKPEGVFKCLPIFSLAFGCQTQLFVMYDALPEPSIMRMMNISKNAISMCTTAYLLVGYFGYVAFCDEPISGDILMNFRPTIFSEAVKMGFVLSVAVSFPLCIFPCRTSIHTLFFNKGIEQPSGTHENFGGSGMVPEPHFKIITMTIVIATLIVGIFLPNIEFVLALTGATMGSLICYIFPAVLFITLMSVAKNTNKSIAQIVLFLGVTIFLASTYTTLYAPNEPKPAGPAVVKVAVPQVPNKINEPNKVQVPAEINKDVKLKGIVEQNDKALLDKEKKSLEESQKVIEDDHRHEPPNPHAPLDTNEAKKLVEKVESLDAKKQIEKKEANPKKVATKPPEVKAPKEENLGQEELKKTKGKSGEVKTEKSEKELKEANKLLKELKEQRNEQQKLLEQQRELIYELKQHKQDAHAENDGKSKSSDKAVDSKAAVAEPVDQKASPAASLTVKPIAQDMHKLKKDNTLAGKQSIDKEQEKQMHKLAIQNHQEQLEKLEKKQLQDQKSKQEIDSVKQDSLQGQQLKNVPAEHSQQNLQNNIDVKQNIPNQANGQNIPLQNAGAPQPAYHQQLGQNQLNKEQQYKQQNIPQIPPQNPIAQNVQQPEQVVQNQFNNGQQNIPQNGNSQNAPQNIQKQPAKFKEQDQGIQNSFNHINQQAKVHGG